MALTDLFKRKPPTDQSTRGGSGRQHTHGFLDYDEINANLTGRYGLEQLDKMWRTDSAVRGALYMVVATIVSGTLTVEPYDGGEEDPTTNEDREIAGFVRWALMEQMRPRLSSHLWTALTVAGRQGFAPFEQVWQLGTYRGRQVFVPRTLDLKLPHSIDKWNQDGPDLTSIEQFMASAGQGKVTYPIEDILYYRFGAEGDNWEGQALIRPAYKHWKYKEGIELVDAIGIERYRVGVPLAYPPNNPTADDLDAAETTLAGLRSNEASYITAPGPKQTAHSQEGWLFEILTPGSAQGGEAVKDSLAYHRTEIYGAVLAEFMRLGQQGVGARATADVQQDPFLAVCEAFAGMTVEDPVNEQLITRLVALNYDTDRLPRLSVSLIDSTTLTELGDYVQKLANAGAIRVEPTLEAYLRDRADLPPADEDALASKAEEMAAQAEQVAKAAAKDPANTSQDTPPPDKTSQLETITLARQDRPLKPWEALMSLDIIEGAINEARGRFEQAGGPSARALAAALAEQVANGKPVRPADPPADLTQALADELAGLYVTGRHTVREELHRQMLGHPGSMVAGYQLDANPSEGASAAERIAARARAAADAIRAAIGTALARTALRPRSDRATLQSAAETAAIGALRAEANLHAAPALNLGRTDQADADQAIIAGSRYTAILDGRACTPCLGSDDDVLRPLSDPVRLAHIPPNPDCQGGDRCRCLEAFQLRSEAAPSA